MARRGLFRFITLLLSSCDRRRQADGCFRVLTRLRRLLFCLSSSSGFGHLGFSDLFVEDEPWGQSSVVLLGLRENPVTLMLLFFPELLFLIFQFLLLSLFFTSLPLFLSLPGLVLGVSSKVRLSFLLFSINAQLELPFFHLLLLLLLVLHQAVLVVGHQAWAGLFLGCSRLLLLWFFHLLRLG